jgi:DNA-binding NarL/FixJ family response regulator
MPANMKYVTKTIALTTAVLRTCCRCGMEFGTDGTERVCLTCRKPRVRKLEPLSRHLTPREKQIVDLVSQAKLNKEIAYELHLSEGTIKEYLNKVYRKLGLKNRTELAVWVLLNPEHCNMSQGPIPVSA